VTLTLFESIQRIVEEEVGRRRTAELAVVQEQQPHADASDQDNYACTVVLRNSGVVLKRVPVATSRIGSDSIPAVGDLVLVQFLDGDVNAPVIVGRLYNDEDRPPPSRDGQAVVHLPLGAGDDDAVHVELTSGDERTVIVKLGKGLDLTVKDDDPVIELKVGDGKATLTIARDGAVTLHADGTLELKGQDVTVQADNHLTLKGSTTDLKGDSVVNIN